MSGPPTRVLHVAQPTDYGVATYVADLVAGQTACQWEVAVASPTSGTLAGTVRALGATHLAWEAVRDPGPGVLAEMRHLRRQVDEFDPDVVHLHSSKAGLAGRAVVRGRRPVIFQPHAWSFLSGPRPLRPAVVRWERAAAKWADAIVCGSRGEHLRGVRAGIEARWHVVPNAIDVERFPFATGQDRHAAVEELGMPPGPLVVCVGRLCAQKGQDVLLDAWPAVRDAVPSARLVLVGDGPDRNAIEARRLPGVQLVGAQTDVRPWLAAASLVVQPSRYETMALSMLEAMATGRSVVATDIEGAREAIGRADDDAAGALVTPSDPHSLAVSVVRRLNDPALAEAEGRAGRRRVEARHHRVASVAAVAAIVRELVTNRRPRRRPRTVATTPEQDH